MAYVWLSGSKTADTKIALHTLTQNTDVSFAMEFQDHSSNESIKHGIIDHGKTYKHLSKKWTKREYYVQHNKDIEHKDVKTYCVTN